MLTRPSTAVQVYVRSGEMKDGCDNEASAQQSISICVISGTGRDGIGGASKGTAEKKSETLACET